MKKNTLMIKHTQHIQAYVFNMCCSLPETKQLVTIESCGAKNYFAIAFNEKWQINCDLKIRWDIWYWRFSTNILLPLIFFLNFAILKLLFFEVLKHHCTPHETEYFHDDMVYETFFFLCPCTVQFIKSNKYLYSSIIQI